MNTGIYKTPWGWIGLAANSRGVRAVVLPKPSKSSVGGELSRMLKKSPSPTPSPSRAEGKEKAGGGDLKAAREAICGYLAGHRRTLDLPLDLDGHSPLRRKVWHVLQTIPYGQKRSYGWVARRLGQPKAARAVGQACGANPFPLIIPCHRVVAGDGSLGGFSGGLSLKKRLLALEAAQLNMGRP
jgi:methylated-DNA-[protein]-cysteine S-methyltransferase